MKIVSGMFKSVHNIMGYQQYDMRSEYVPIPYLIQERAGDGTLILNTLTREVIFLSEGEWEEEPIKKLLAEHWYLIPAETDAGSLAYLFRHCHNHRYGKKLGKFQLVTVFTTTECNARCHYCYEAGCHKRTMTERVAMDVAKFIEARAAPGLHLKWFGGEPLCNPSAIDTICKYLQEHGVEYDSSMVTNGYLIGQHNAGQLLSLWRLSRVQVTLDGTEENYNRIKGYAISGNPFGQVIRNIGYLLGLGVRVDIRLNLSMDNYEDLNDLTDMLLEQFGKYRGLVNVYSHPLFECGVFQPTEEERALLYDRYIALQDRIAEYGIGRRPGIPRIRYTNCMADDGVSTVILPGGELSLCEHHCDDEFYGTIYSDEYDQDVIQRWREPEWELQECADCALYPMCIRLEKCPGKIKCNADHRRLRYHRIKQAILLCYKNNRKG